MANFGQPGLPKGATGLFPARMGNQKLKEFFLSHQKAGMVF